MSTWYTLDAGGWLSGTSPEPVPGAVSDPPPAHAGEAAPGQLWPRWWRAGWMLDVLPMPPEPELAYAIDPDGWYAGQVPVGTAGSTRAAPDLLSTTTTPGEPRSRWRFGSWEVQAYALPPRHITTLAFRQRFTRAERGAVELAALDTPDAPMPQRQAAAELRSDLKDQAQARYIDLDRADTRAGVLALEAAGLIGPGRALQILDDPIQPTERP